MKRREFLTIPASALGGTLLYTLAREPFLLQAQEGNVKIPLRFFTAAEAREIAREASPDSRRRAPSKGGRRPFVRQRRRSMAGCRMARRRGRTGTDHPRRCSVGTFNNIDR